LVLQRHGWRLQLWEKNLPSAMIHLGLKIHEQPTVTIGSIPIGPKN
jgi:hypothetical protein